MTTAIPHGTTGRRPVDEQRRALLRTARDVADDLAADAIVRDQAGTPSRVSTVRSPTPRRP
ncbi:hypothetical protein [Streptomyces sp. NPDC041003]|uniref:hypothetical protein n=1 Tax=Streptomyces sp. NPDC041003 TaxID=3155730 RepID=UPI00340ADFAE